MFSSLLSLGPWEVVAPRVSIPWNVAAAHMDRGQLRGVSMGTDIEYGTYDLIYAGENELSAQNAGSTAMVALALTKDIQLQKESLENRWSGDFELTEDRLYRLMNDNEFLTALSVFFDDRNRQYVEQTLNQKLHSLMLNDSLSSANLLLLGRERNNNLRIAYNAYDKRAAAQVSAIVVSNSGYGDYGFRTFDGGNVFIDKPRYDQVRLSAIPQSIPTPGFGITFIAKGNYAAFNETLQSYIQAFGESWATGQFEIDDSAAQYVFTRYSVIHNLLYTGRRIVNGSEMYKLRDCLMGEINAKGRNAHLFPMVSKNDHNQGHIDSHIPGVVLVTTASAPERDPSSSELNGEIRDKA